MYILFQTEQVKCLLFFVSLNKRYQLKLSQDVSDPTLQKRQSGSWGPYNRQTYWSHQREPTIDRTIDKTFQVTDQKPKNGLTAGLPDGLFSNQKSQSG
jgi:hypothetical protein